VILLIGGISDVVDGSPAAGVVQFAEDVDISRTRGVSEKLMFSVDIENMQIGVLGTNAIYTIWNT
jgi:hypothetical protein